MSTDDPHALDVTGPIKAMGKHIQGDAYWIVKLAFHPEWKSRFVKTG
ncbi:MAG: hypothetical protein LBC31_08750 [Treponema sp.]|jgi:hypothetical protein|nr:hypothetical protein [Treponema sp.]